MTPRASDAECRRRAQIVSYRRRRLRPVLVSYRRRRLATAATPDENQRHRRSGSAPTALLSPPSLAGCSSRRAKPFARMELRRPRALDLLPSWTRGDVLTELDALQPTLRAAPRIPLKQLAECAREKAFVMRVEEEDDTKEEDDNRDEDARAIVTTGARFSFNNLELTFQESGDGLYSSGTTYQLMDKRSPDEKSILLELRRQHRLKTQEDVRSKLSSLDVQNDIQRTISASSRLQKYAESRKELDRRLDAQFQRKIALDKQLSMVQRDHEQRSQIVESRIRDDVAVEDAERREQSVKDEKLKQETIRQEAEARQKAVAAQKLAAEAQNAAYEAAKKEAVEKEAAKFRAEAVSTSSQSSQSAAMADSIEIRSEFPGIKVYVDSSALKEESLRRALHDQVPSNIYLSKEYSRYDRQIGKSIFKFMPTIDSVEAMASELITALDGQDCPRPIACRIFADKMVSIVKSRNPTEKCFEKLAFACGYLMLLVTDRVPDAMDYLVAEFHKVSVYTVPKHLHALNAQARNTDYFRLIGYQEEDGKLESTEAYLVNVVAYVKLYAAMIQTDIKGVRHPHGLAEGWKWLAVFLNTLPAITATAFALHAFLKMAGFALHRRCGSQFVKILDVISQQFIPALKERGSEVDPEAIRYLQNYLNDKNNLKEPEGQYLAQQLLSKGFM